MEPTIRDRGFTSSDDTLRINYILQNQYSNVNVFKKQKKDRKLYLFFFLKNSSKLFKKEIKQEINDKVKQNNNVLRQL